jgi:hypothetical protein
MDSVNAWQVVAARASATINTECHLVKDRCRVCIRLLVVRLVQVERETSRVRLKGAIAVATFRFAGEMAAGVGATVDSSTVEEL